MSSRGPGLRLLRAGLSIIAAFLAFVGGYLVWAAWAHPEVRLRRPRWVEGAFDHSYWLPVLVVTIGGAVLVALVLVAAYRRMLRGDDLYEGRIGRGVRRRGERYLDGDATGAEPAPLTESDPANRP